MAFRPRDKERIPHDSQEVSAQRIHIEDRHDVGPLHIWLAAEGKRAEHHLFLGVEGGKSDGSFRAMLNPTQLPYRFQENRYAGGIIGCRMTGGGFGGCAVSLVQTEAVQRITRKLDDLYEKKTGRQTGIFSSRPAAGARVLKPS